MIHTVYSDRQKKGNTLKDKELKEEPGSTDVRDDKWKALNGDLVSETAGQNCWCTHAGIQFLIYVNF